MNKILGHRACKSNKVNNPMSFKLKKSALRLVRLPKCLALRIKSMSMKRLIDSKRLSSSISRDGN